MIKDVGTKLPLQEQEYNDENKQYQQLKQQRINAQTQIKQLIKDCNDMIKKENNMYKKVQKKEAIKNKTIENVNSMKASFEAGVFVIKLYNNFIENNTKYIDKIHENFDRLWNEFESKWLEWNNTEIVIWFKYKTIEMDQKNIKWEKIEQELKSRNVSGQSLTQFNPLTFEFIGLKNMEMVSYLVSQIDGLKEKYKERDNVDNGVNDDMKKVPEQYKCPITKKIMKDPVMAFDGHSYERKDIEEYLTRNNKSPVTGEIAQYIVVFPNHKLKAEIEKFLVENNINIDKFNERIQIELNETEWL